MDSWFADLTRKQENLIADMVHAELLAKLDNYEQVVKSFSKFFDTDELAAVLERKADMELVRRLQDNKAEAKDLTVLQANLNALNNRLKHVSVVQAELAEATVSVVDETNVKARESLRDHSRIICKWIYNGLQKPESFESQDLQFDLGLAQDTISSFGRSQDLSGSTTRHRDKTVSYLQTKAGSGMKMTLNRKSPIKMQSDLVPKELVKYENDFLHRRKMLKKNGKNTLSVEAANTMNASLNNSILSVGGKSPRPNTHANNVRDRKAAAQRIGYMVPKRHEEGSIDSPHNLGSIQTNGRRNSQRDHKPTLLVSP